MERKPYAIGFQIAESISENTEFATVEFSHDAKRDKVRTLPDGHESIVMSLGKQGPMKSRDGRLIARRLIQFAKREGIKRLMLDRERFYLALRGESANLSDLLIEFLMANYVWDIKKEPEEGRGFVEEVVLVDSRSGNLKQIQETITRAGTIGAGVNLARDLANARANVMTPQAFCDEAIRLAAGLPITVEVLTPREMRELGMGGILAVGGGSVNEPRLLIMQYMAGTEGEKPIALVGKGVVYDSGGYAIKPPESMVDMNKDKAGAAAVVAAFITAAKLGVKKNVIALVPLVENSISGTAYRNGDIIRMMNGKTVEVINTDAEGRLILGDALFFARRYVPRLVIDVASLTGAARTAIGPDFTGLFVHDTEDGKALAERLTALGEQTGDRVWHLPLDERHHVRIKSDHADLRNTGKTGALSGASTAAAFLEEFVGDVPWAHLDMAPASDSAEGEHLAPGAKGATVRLLVRMLEGY